ncbi:MAG TPA: DNA primase [Actinomycetota bacterium]|nr:DNA primase [Actinomycetota bacterium]
MARIRQEDIEAVRERTDIVRLVQQYIALKKAGRAFSGLCPFHPEKTPSFSVDPGKQVYYCFGCGAGGNAFHFLEQVEGVTFPEAVERLAGPAGITLRYEGVSPGERRQISRKQSLYRANQRAADLYRKMLLEGREAEGARKYLASRGITKESVEAFGVGFAPGYPDFLLRRLSRDLSPELLVEAGLAIRDERSVRDRFRARITFPAHDVSGNAVGIGARLLEGDGPKYLNSPETPVYRKQELLYNLNRAKGDISRSERAFLVEGYTDVIALHQAGVTTAVATCGTAVGEGHFRLLSRFARRVVLAFDSDEAGARAAERAYAFHERYPLQASVLVLPEGVDPADFALGRGGEAFEELASGAAPLVEFMLRRAVRGHDLATPEGRTRAVQAGMPIVAGLDDPVRRSEYAGMLADLAGVDVESVLLELARRPAGGDGAGPGRQRSAEEPGPSRRTAEPRSPDREVEKEALKLLAQHPDLCLGRVSTLEHELFTSERNRKTLALLLEPWSSASQLMERARDRGVGELVAEIAVEPLKGEVDRTYAAHVFSRLEELSLKRRMDTMRKRLERLNPVKDPDAFDSLFKELADLTSRWRDLQARAGEGA